MPLILLMLYGIMSGFISILGRPSVTWFFNTESKQKYLKDEFVEFSIDEDSPDIGENLAKNTGAIIYPGSNGSCEQIFEYLSVLVK